MKNPRNNPTVAVPTDKTGSFRTMEIDEYTKQMRDHLLANGKEVSRAKVVLAHSQAEKFIQSKESLLSDNELSYLKQKKASKAIPTPKLLIKDHKKKDE